MLDCPAALQQPLAHCKKQIKMNAVASRSPLMLPLPARKCDWRPSSSATVIFGVPLQILKGVLHITGLTDTMKSHLQLSLATKFHGDLQVLTYLKLHLMASICYMQAMRKWFLMSRLSLQLVSPSQVGRAVSFNSGASSFPFVESWCPDLENMTLCKIETTDRLPRTVA